MRTLQAVNVLSDHASKNRYVNQVKNGLGGDGSMIFESWFWKRELAGLISELEAWGPRHIRDFKEDFWHGESGFRVERSFFHSAMAVRRLIDSNKVTDRITGKSFSLEAYRARAQGPHTGRSILGSVDILEWFEMNNAERINMSPYKLASEILHSFTLEFLANEAETDIDSILVASERNQFVRAVAIPRTTWVDLLCSIVDDRVEGMTIEATANGGEPKVQIY